VRKRVRPLRTKMRSVRGMEASDFMSRVEKIIARLEQPMVTLRQRKQQQQRW
jgi:hypothetical protein